MSQRLPRQGEIWTITTQLANISREHVGVVLTGSSRVRANGPVAIARVRDALTIPIAEQLLSVPIPDSGQVGAVYDIAAFPCAWFSRREGELPEESMLHLRAALSAYFELN